MNESQHRFRRVVTETPFGPTFDAFCAERRWEPADPATLKYPSHAMVLLEKGITMTWPRFQKPYLSVGPSWNMIMNRPALVRVRDYDAGFFESKKETEQIAQESGSTGHDTSKLVEPGRPEN